MSSVVFILESHNKISKPTLSKGCKLLSTLSYLPFAFLGSLSCFVSTGRVYLKNKKQKEYFCGCDFSQQLVKHLNSEGRGEHVQSSFRDNSKKILIFSGVKVAALTMEIKKKRKRPDPVSPESSQELVRKRRKKKNLIVELEAGS